MTNKKVIGKFRVENGKIVGREWKNVGWRNVSWGKCLKKVIGNLAYREMLFLKKPWVWSNVIVVHGAWL